LMASQKEKYPNFCVLMQTSSQPNLDG
jgi:hypothetical protein